MHTAYKRADVVSAIQTHFNAPFWTAVRSAALTKYNAGHRPPLLTINPKVEKGVKKSYKTLILHFAPSLASGFQMCGNESFGCAAGCLNTKGRGAENMFPDGSRHRVHVARVVRALWFRNDLESFLVQLVRETALGIQNAKKAQLTPVFRYNGTSDVLWERIPVTIDQVLSDYIKGKTGRRVKPATYLNMMQVFHWVQFYDYTKIMNRKGIPANYDLTFSRSESNSGDVLKVLKDKSMRVAVIFRLNSRKKEAFPPKWQGYDVIDGDDTDLRFLDQKGVVVGLRSKGDSIKDTSGFVVEAKAKELVQ